MTFNIDTDFSNFYKSNSFTGFVKSINRFFDLDDINEIIARCTLKVLEKEKKVFISEKEFSTYFLTNLKYICYDYIHEKNGENSNNRHHHIIRVIELPNLLLEGYDSKNNKIKRVINSLKDENNQSNYYFSKTELFELLEIHLSQNKKLIKKPSNLEFYKECLLIRDREYLRDKYNLSDTQLSGKISVLNRMLKKILTKKMEETQVNSIADLNKLCEKYITEFPDKKQFDILMTVTNYEVMKTLINIEVMEQPIISSVWTYSYMNKKFILKKNN